MSDIDIVDKLLDLQKQATTEQSHYYTANCITKAIQEIIELRKKLIAPKHLREHMSEKEAQMEVKKLLEARDAEWRNIEALDCIDGTIRDNDTREKLAKKTKESVDIFIAALTGKEE